MLWKHIPITAASVPILIVTEKTSTQIIVGIDRIIAVIIRIIFTTPEGAIFRAAPRAKKKAIAAPPIVVKIDSAKLIPSEYASSPMGK